MKKSSKSNKRKNIKNSRKTRKNIRKLSGGGPTDFTSSDKEEFTQTDLLNGELTQVGLDKKLYTFSNNKENETELKLKDCLVKNVNLVKLLNSEVLNKLTFLDLTNNHLFMENNDNIENICNFLEKSTMIKTLLINNCFDFYTTLDMKSRINFKKFFNAIGNNKSLLTLDIRNNNFFMPEELFYFYCMYDNLVKNKVIKTIFYKKYLKKVNNKNTYVDNKTLIINDLFYKMIKISIEDENYSYNLKDKTKKLFQSILAMIDNDAEFIKNGKKLSSNEIKNTIEQYIPLCINIIKSIIDTTNTTNNTDNGIPTNIFESETF